MTAAVFVGDNGLVIQCGHEVCFGEAPLTRQLVRVF